MVTTTLLPRIPARHASRDGLASPNVRTVAPGTSARPGTVRVIVTIGDIEVGVLMRAKRTGHQGPLADSLEPNQKTHTFRKIRMLRLLWLYDMLEVR